MIYKVLIPQAFENMEEATIGAWIAKPGEHMHVGAPLCELITEKTTFDLPAENSGAVKHIFAPEKSIVPVGYCIALLGDSNEELSPEFIEEMENANKILLEKRSAATQPSESKLEVSLTKPKTPASSALPTGRIRATPAARRIARERNLDLEKIAASLPGKVLTEQDVINCE